MKKYLHSLILLLAVTMCMLFSFTSHAANTPARVTNLKVVVSGTKKQTLSWKKVKKATGYEIYCKDLTAGDTEYKRVKKLKGATKVKYTVSKRKAGHTYVYTVRAYKVVSGQTYYGNYSVYKSSTMPSSTTTTASTSTTTTSSSSSTTTTTSSSTSGLITNPTTKQKYKLVFGDSSLSMRYPGGYYTSESQAKANMVSITVKTWDFASGKSGSKVTRTWTIKVHKNLAATVKQIFLEIYNGSEKFPIHELGGYDWRGGHSEHNTGTAIDINWTENYMVNVATGVITCGKYWKPGVDPYSIPKDGEVAKIFNKYGFTQGDWGNSKDYMHFSYFGT